MPQSISDCKENKQTICYCDANCTGISVPCRANSKGQFMLGQSVLLKTRKGEKELFLPQLEKEKLLLTCLPAPGGGCFCCFLGGFFCVLLFVFKSPSGKANLRWKPWSNPERFKFSMCKELWCALVALRHRLHINEDLLELLREALHPNDRN